MGKAAQSRAGTPTPETYALPSQARTLEGFNYDPRRDLWLIGHLNRTVEFRFDRLLALELSVRLVSAFKGVMVAKLASVSAKAAQSLYKELAVFLRHVACNFVGVTTISMEHLVSYRGDGDRARLVASSRLHSNLRRWNRLGIPGIDRDALEYALEARKVSYDLGRPVRTRCPIHGPYTQLE